MSALPEITHRSGHCDLTRTERTFKGATERKLTIETDQGYTQLVISSGDLAVLKVSHHSFGSSFQTLDDNGLAALGHEIQSYFARKALREKIRAQAEG